MKKMNKALKKKWVKALRSGEYDQGRGLLRNGTKFCCLGVLADVAGALAYPGLWDDNGCLRDTTLPPNRFAGLGPLEQDTLITMNDHDRRSFHEIADYIEENL